MFPLDLKNKLISHPYTELLHSSEYSDIVTEVSSPSFWKAEKSVNRIVFGFFWLLESFGQMLLILNIGRLFLLLI